MDTADNSVVDTVDNSVGDTADNSVVGMDYTIAVHMDCIADQGKIRLQFTINVSLEEITLKLRIMLQRTGYLTHFSHIFNLFSDFVLNYTIFWNQRRGITITGCHQGKQYYEQFHFLFSILKRTLFKKWRTLLFSTNKQTVSLVSWFFSSLYGDYEKILLWHNEMVSLNYKPFLITRIESWFF